MKLTAFILMIGCLQVGASGVSQTIKFDGVNVPLKTVFKAIEQQTGYVVFYDEDLFANQPHVTLSVTNEPLTAFLKKLIVNREIDYSVEDKTIVFTRMPKASYKGPANTLASLRILPIKGTIRDENNEPVAGVSILIKGSTLGTTSDAEGNFSFTNIAENATLVISGANIVTQEVTVQGRSVLNISVKLNIKEQEVVIAYGRQKKKNVTGSVATITADNIKDLPPTINLEQALQGQAAGVYVVQENGQPGAATRVRVRGSSSLLSSNQPLYVVDGVPVTADQNIPNDNSAFNREILQQGLSSPLNNINPADIESMTVLKDASATAIYGSRAANGVILITTKRGNAAGKTSYNFNSSISVQEAQTLDVLNAQQFREMWTEAANNSTSTAVTAVQMRNGTYFKDANTNWEDEVGPSSPITSNANFSLSGGNEKVRYFTSISTTNQNGVFDNSGFKRYSFLMNLDLALSRAIKVGTSLNLSNSNQVSPDGNLAQRMYFFRPDLSVYNPDGTFTFSDGFVTENPVALSKARNNNRTNLLIGSVYGEATLARDFKLRSVLSINYNNGDFKSFYPSQTYKGGWTKAAGAGSGFAQQSNSEFLSTLWENTLNYNKIFNNKHELDVVVGASFQGDKNEYLQASGQGFPQDDVLNNLGSATSNFIIGSGQTNSGLVSYFGRINYTLSDKYILSISARADASSKFAPENKWAFFPTVSGAWRISDEDFLRDVPWLEDLKLRASTGVTGNQGFTAYQWRTLFGSTEYNGRPAVIQNQLGNGRLKWELTRQTDIGIDFSLFKGRLHGIFDYYEKHTSDLLFNVKLPSNTGYANVPGNLGSSLNKGIELTLTSDIISNKNFKWTLSVNASRNVNKLVKLNSDFLDTIKGTITPPGTASVLKEGSPLGLFYGRVAEGIIQNKAQLDALNARAADGIYQYALTAPGDLWFRDITGPNGVPDGKVTTLDQTVIGNVQPDLSGGIANTFQYKRFRLSGLFTYSIGNDLNWNVQASMINFQSTATSENKTVDVLNRWTPSNPTNQPRAVYGDPNNNYFGSSFYIHDASYLRLKNVFLAYSLPELVINKIRILKTMEFTFSATNLFTITKYPGANPEASSLFNNDLTAGVDNNRFPIAKVYTASIRIGF